MSVDNKFFLFVFVVSLCIFAFPSFALLFFVLSILILSFCEMHIECVHRTSFLDEKKTHFRVHVAYMHTKIHSSFRRSLNSEPPSALNPKCALYVRTDGFSFYHQIFVLDSSNISINNSNFSSRCHATRNNINAYIPCAICTTRAERRWQRHMHTHTLMLTQNAHKKVNFTWKTNKRKLYIADRLGERKGSRRINIVN